MAINQATITFSLPEDTNSNYLNLYSSPLENGVFSLVATQPYDYGNTTMQVELNDVNYYKIQFIDSQTNRTGPMSGVVYGGKFDSAAPFLAVSTTTDGANYATVQDVLDYSDLTSEEVTAKKVSNALRRARAEIDYRTSEMGIDRFDMFDSGTARRKYNAALHILKEAEICLALGQIYTNLSDNVIIGSLREGQSSSAGSISIGGTSISGDSLAERNESILYLASLAARYEAMAEEKLAALDQNSIRLVATEWATKLPRFRYPFNWA